MRAPSRSSSFRSRAGRVVADRTRASIRRRWTSSRSYGYDSLHPVDHIGVGYHPVPVGVGILVRPLEWTASEIEDLRSAQLHERFEPAHQLFRALFHEHHLPVAHAQRQDLAVVADIEEELSGALPGLANKVREQVVAIDVDLVGLIAGRVALQQLRADVLLARSGEKCGQPVLMRGDVVQYSSMFDLARPAHEDRHAPAAFPV